jgi:acetyl-CoA/propionyl-CoA carboxylase
VSAYYDSLVAKLIAWGRDFEEARIRTRNALDEFRIEGVNTTIPLYKTIMEEKNFMNGELSTDYLDRFKLIDRMNEDAKEKSKNVSSAAVAAILLQTEFLKKEGNGGGAGRQSRARLQKSNWKRLGRDLYGI